ncbi:MAG: hypothetical protein RL272_483 [Candidatus Parcubacteria bacterium]
MLALAFLSLLYLHLGYQIGKKGWKVWKRKDSRSKTSLLFFPIRRRNRRVGKGGFFMDGSEAADDEIAYKIVMTIGWLPLMALNLATICLAIGPEALLSRLLAKRPTLAQRNARLALAARNLDRGLEREFEALAASPPAAAPSSEAARPTASAAQAAEPVPVARKRRKTGGSAKKRRTRPAQARQTVSPPEPITVRVEIDVNDRRDTAPAPASTAGPTASDGRLRPPDAGGRGHDLN